MKANWTDVIAWLALIGLTFYAIWKRDFVEAIFWYLVLSSAEAKLKNP